MKLINKVSIILSSLFLFLSCLPICNQALAAEWEIVTSPNVSNRANHLNAVSHVSDTDIWAVGASVNPSNSNDRQALIEHYDGNEWSIIPSAEGPSLGYSDDLNGVAAIASDNVWAVGSSGQNSLIQHWDGSSWHLITSLTPPISNNSRLSAVTANSADDIWAVGSYTSSLTLQPESMIQHYNGTSWSIAYTSQNENEYLNAVSAINGNNVWAVGASIDGYGEHALIKHWNGTGWSNVSIPYPNDASSSRLLGVSGSSSDDIWAVGLYLTPDNTMHSLIMHYNGSTWSIIPTDINNFPKVLSAVTAASANDVWAVGERDNEIRIVRFNGTSWDIVPSPSNTPFVSPFSLRGITRISTENVWAVGVSNNDTLVEHYSSGITPPSSSFDILTNGYKFKNFGLEANWAMFEATFGSAQVNGVMKPFAEAYFNNVFVPVLIGGNCFGISTTSLLFYAGIGNQNLLDQFNATNAHDLPDPGNYLYFPRLKQLWNATPVTEYIAKYQGWATSKEFETEYISSTELEILDIYESIKQKLAGGAMNSVVIGITDINGKGAHAVVPYKTEEVSDGSRRIYVYDPNTPCLPATSCNPLDSDGPYRRYIKINSGADPEWEFDFYSGTFTTWHNPYIYFVPINHIDDTPTLPFAADVPAYQHIYAKGYSDLFISGSQGQGIGYQNGTYVKNLPGANIIIPPLDGTAESTPSYRLPLGAYSILVQGTRVETNTIDVFGPDTLLQVTNLQVATGSADRIATNENHRAMTITTEEAEKTYDANLYVQLEGTQTREFNVRGLSVGQDESDTVKITDDNNAVEITNEGAADTFYLSLKQIGNEEEVLGSEQEVTIQSGQTFQIAPTDWDHLGSAALLINTSSENEVQIKASPFMRDVTVNMPFTVDVKISSTDNKAFNAARSTVTVSSNLQVVGINSPESNACNFQYTKAPTKANPSFAGGLFGSSSTECTVYTLVLKPKTAGTGVVTFSNASVKSFDDNTEILDNAVNGEYSINSTQPTATPTIPLAQLAITSQLKTYLTDYTLVGTKDPRITKVFVNGSDANSFYPTDTTWQVPMTLTLGTNTLTLYGKDNQANQTSTKTVSIARHTLGDINGDGEINLIDASLFAVDWDKTQDLTYNLSDMNGDGNVDLTDLSILAKLQ